MTNILLTGIPKTKRGEFAETTEKVSKAYWGGV